MAIHIIFDYGHGINCPGKHSPDMSFYEWKFNRALGKKVAEILRAKGYQVHEIWTQDHEPLSTTGEMCSKTQLNAALNWRWKEVNKLCAQFGTLNCICISFHSNAAGGDGQWHNATGFMSIVGLKASANSKRLAKCIYDEAAKRGIARESLGSGWSLLDSEPCDVRQDQLPGGIDGIPFYDNRSDLSILQSQAGMDKLVQTHVQGIINYINS